MRERAVVTEAGPRDGLQNEPCVLPVAERIVFIEKLADAGLPRIEAGAFVSNERVPQMADSESVVAGVSRREGLVISALVPNLRGLERARQAGAQEIAVFASATESFSEANLQCPVAQCLERIRETVAAARMDGIEARGYVSCAFGCPFEGPVPAAQTMLVAEEIANIGCSEVILADTIGSGTPESVREVFAAAVATFGADRVGAHFHDTGGRARENLRAALDLGIWRFDGSAGGLGGCPFAPGAPGNQATEEIVAELEAVGIKTGVDSPAVAAAGDFARTCIARAR